MSKIIVIWDSMIDQYIYGNTDRKNPESPMPLLNVEKEEIKLWGASNVAHNIASLSGDVDLITMIGDDWNGKDFSKLCENAQINLIALFSDSPTITKKRFLDSQHKQQLLRVDYEKKSPISLENIQKIWKILSTKKASYILISDYNKWLVQPELIDTIKQISQKQWSKILVDAKPYNISLFEWVYLIKPNFKEFSEMIGQQWLENTDENIEKFGKIFTSKYKTNLVVTRWEKWASLISLNGSVEHIPPKQMHKVFDVTGAWDTFIATVVYALDNGFSLLEAIKLANKASWIVVWKVGASNITKEELWI